MSLETKSISQMGKLRTPRDLVNGDRVGVGWGPSCVPAAPAGSEPEAPWLPRWGRRELRVWMCQARGLCPLHAAGGPYASMREGSGSSECPLH